MQIVAAIMTLTSAITTNALGNLGKHVNFSI